MVLNINYTNTVEQIIRIILRTHKNESMRPALQYDQPEQYELRLHEGDGIPDEDFELERDKQLEEYGKETEYCLCDAFDDDFVMEKVIGTSGGGGIGGAGAGGGGGHTASTESNSRASMVVS